MSAKFELCHLHCEYVELHAPLSFGLDEHLIKFSSDESSFTLTQL